ncbi:hypothetical protein BDZ88DRAFT_505929 [Geranomyces variabilis]|nr:hypothetical protein BDZ88DRAFT_505929 [Geranomyces variabilis]KAJ3134779.1 hypothetical protein HDU90_004809 [Geranomyces variabilis]
MSAVIRLMDSSGVSVLDSVATDYEDSFSLETFGDLIEAHRASEPVGTKELIIARVQTWDHKQPERAYYSYYNAYHLNKILIKTQRYKGKRLIHRLHVLNPLTNTDIIGNVQYFHVQGAKKTVQLQEPKEPLGEPASGPQIIGTAEASDLGTPQEQLDHVEGQKEDVTTPLRPVSRPDSSPKKRMVPSLVIQTTAPTGFLAHGDGAPLSPSVQEVERGVLTSTWTRSAPSAVEAPPDEDDVLIEEPPNSSATPNRPPQARKRSIFAAMISPRRKSQATTLAKTDEEESSAPAPQPLQAGNSDSSDRRRPQSAGDMRHQRPVTSPPSQTAPMSAFPDLVTTPMPAPDATKVPAPAGQITRFAVPVPQAELGSVAPPTNRNRRRTLSFHNAVSTSGATNASFEDWLSMVHQEKRKLQRKGAALESVGEEYDVVKPFGGRNRQSAMKRARLGAIIASPIEPSTTGFSDVPGDQQNDHTLPLVQAEGKEDETASDDDELGDLPSIYDAHLFATDIDFLESSQIRTIFRENALSTEESKLFELPAVPRETPTTETPIILAYPDDTCLCC